MSGSEEYPPSTVYPLLAISSDVIAVSAFELPIIYGN